MDRRTFIQTSSWATAGFALSPLMGTYSCTSPDANGILFKHFTTPPADARAGGYWWWLNGLVDKEGIARDLREFKEKGVGDLLMVNSAGRNMPVGVKFLSEEWKELFRYALSEARKHGISIGMNLSSGWCMGGPWITPEMAGRWFLQSGMNVRGPVHFSGKLPLPTHRSGYDQVFNPPGYREYIDLPLEELDYRDTSVVAFRLPDAKNSQLDEARKALLPAKTNRRDASNWTPAQDVMRPTRVPLPNQPEDRPVDVGTVIDLTEKVGADGSLEWDVPEGSWVIVRTGHRMTGSRLSIAQPEADGLSVAWLNSLGVDKQFEMLGKQVLEEADKAGYPLTFFCDDSFEDGFPNWTYDLTEMFRQYRGYDPTPYFPVFAGYIIGSAEISDRFLHDYRKTVADCMADRHYGRFAELCHQHGMKVQNESAGPSRSGTMCMDALKNLGRSDLPSGEFWLGIRHDEAGGLDLPYGESRLERGQNKVTKMVASAAHLYGKQTAAAESYTTYRHWQDSPATLKQSTDRAFCEGINRLMIHTITATRPRDGKPGYEYYAGTHLNPNVTWWEKAGDFFAYINRCQYLLRQGLFVADVLFYNGDWAPNIVEPKHIDPSLGRGYDYDVCNEEILLTRLSVENGRLVLPDGMSYRILVLPDSEHMPAGTLAKIAGLVKAGATVVGRPPVKDPGLKDYPACDQKVQALAAGLWGDRDGGKSPSGRTVGKGRVFEEKGLRELLLEDGIQPDFEIDNKTAQIDFIHRSTPDHELYFLANLNGKPEKGNGSFRVSGRPPELWDPVTAKKITLPQYRENGTQTTIPLSFEGFQSFFLLFPREAKNKKAPDKKPNFPAFAQVAGLEGAWTVRFDPQWGGPETVVFDRLQDWTQREEDSIRYYSGKATYGKQFDLPDAPKGKIYLDLGVVKDIAEVRLNGRKLGVVWTNPWRVEITGAVRTKKNDLEIEIINQWPNRLIGDAQLPEDKRFTRTNISLKKDARLMPSGLLGPVSILKEI